MTYSCDISGKGPLVGNNVSHANNRTKKRQMPNLVVKKFYSAALGREVQLRIAQSVLRTIDKNGIEAVLKSYNKTWKELA